MTRPLPRVVALLAVLSLSGIAPGCGTGPGDPGALATGTTGRTGEVIRTIALGGDILIHENVTAAAARAGAVTGRPYDFGALLSPLAPVLDDVDLALCHLEVPLTGPPFEGYPLFRAPLQLAEGIRDVGYDGCSTASNHSLDAGHDGVVSTLVALEAAGLGHVGTARTPTEDVTPRVYDLDGVGVGHLSYTFGLTSGPVPEDAPWSVDVIDVETIARDAAATRAAGADIVVVSVHWGTEYEHRPDAFQTSTASALAAVDDVDLVVGHHAHVVQPIAMVDGTWVAYGLGNQLSGQLTLTRRDGLTVVATAGGPPGGRLRVRDVEAVPTWVDVDPGDFDVLPIAETLAREDLEPVRREGLGISLRRTMDVVRSLGADVATRTG